MGCTLFSPCRYRMGCTPCRMSITLPVTTCSLRLNIPSMQCMHAYRYTCCIFLNRKVRKKVRAIQDRSRPARGKQNSSRYMPSCAYIRGAISASTSRRYLAMAVPLILAGQPHGCIVRCMSLSFISFAYSIRSLIIAPPLPDRRREGP